MWGDAESACQLEESDELAALLWQVTGPAHLPLNDPRWQDLLHAYDILVHLDVSSSSESWLDKCSQAMAQNAANSSNLAALALHVTRMVRELNKSLVDAEGGDQQESRQPAAAFSERIALVGKARATAGALQLLRLLVHPIFASDGGEGGGDDSMLVDVLTYRSRDVVSERHAKKERLVASELINAVLAFVSTLGGKISEDSLHGRSNIPELYDALVLAFQLLLVLLSHQLYHPMVSTAQRQGQPSGNHILEFIMKEGAIRRQQHQGVDRHEQHEAYESSLGPNGNSNGTAVPKDHHHLKDSWTPQSLLQSCLDWTLHRPSAPPRSIAHHQAELAQSVVEARNEKMAADCMYEHHAIVMAVKPQTKKESAAAAATKESAAASRGGGVLAHKPPSRIIFDATRGVLVMSSSLILLPFRLLGLALHLWGFSSKGHHKLLTADDQLVSLKIQHSLEPAGTRTNDVLWLSNSPVADLSSCLLLLLTHNHHSATTGENPFRVEMTNLNDMRWEGHGGPSSAASEDPLAAATAATTTNGEMRPLEEVPLNGGLSPPLSRPLRPHHLTVNFESLFASFGDTLHTEVGALVLYTLLQSSPVFAASVAVRSDLDTLVMPLLRTLYFSSTTKHFGPTIKRQSSRNSMSDTAPRSIIKSYPFRSQSQLYVILILLLLFSQDASFGPDAFRRVRVATVVWYKERQLKDISLGSLLLLSLLREITFNLSRLQDAFLLNNCCAVLLNLAPHMVHLHDYAAMRLATVTLSCLKRYVILYSRNRGQGDDDEEEEDVMSEQGMYGEACRTLLQLLRHCLGIKNIETNLHLVYALVYQQMDYNHLFSAKDSPFTQFDIGLVQGIISRADSLIQDGEARTAPRAMQVLQESVGSLKEVSSSFHHRRRQPSRGDSGNTMGDFTFTYEEEADPEIFFIPYVWDVIVCVVTACSLEWHKSKIQVFPLLEEAAAEVSDSTVGTGTPPGAYAKDVEDVV